MPDTRLQLVLDQWPIESRPEIVHAFNSGLNHNVYLVKTDVQQWVIKLFNQTMPMAVELQRWAAKQRLAPQILFSGTDDSYMVMEYLTSPSLKPVSVDQLTLAAVVIGLRELHSAPMTFISEGVGQLDILTACEHYLRAANKSFKQAHQALLPALELFIADDTPLCLCHNDLVAENCFIVGGQLRLIDWEFAQLNNPWFDLAATIHYLQLGEVEARQFLNAYRTGYGSKNYQAIFNAALCTVLWLDVLWHVKKFGEGRLPSLDKKITTIQQSAAKLNIDWSI